MLRRRRKRRKLRRRVAQRGESMVFVSMSLRMRIDVEAANMVESAGNYSRHRIVPIITRVHNEDGSIEYQLSYLPGISGQAIGNAYTRALVDVSVKRGLSVCDDCKKYEYIGGFPKRPVIEEGPSGKSSDSSGSGSSGSEQKQEDSVDKRVKECVIEDITGFMATKSGEGGRKGQSIRRTSAVMFSYMVPDTDTVRHSPPIPQFHVRYSSSKEEQKVFSIESSSAIYRLLVAIDVDKIGRLTNGSYVDDRVERVRAAFDALVLMFQGYLFAKKARYLPQAEFLGGIVAVSDPYKFMVSPAKARPVNGKLMPWYIIDTLERARKFKASLSSETSESSDKSMTLEIYYFDNEFNFETKAESQDITATRVSNFEELVKNVRDAVLKLIGGGQ
mgnify:CR=1 FL=1